MMKRLSVVVAILTILLFPTSALAEQISFTTMGEIISFDTGDGSLGDLHLKADGAYVRGDLYGGFLVPIDNSNAYSNSSFYSRKFYGKDSKNNLYMLINDSNTGRLAVMSSGSSSFELLPKWDITYFPDEMYIVEDNVWALPYNVKQINHLRYYANGAWHTPTLNLTNENIQAITTDGINLYINTISNKFYKINKDGSVAEQLSNPPSPNDASYYWSYTIEAKNGELYVFNRYGNVLKYSQNNWNVLGNNVLTNSQNYSDILVDKNNNIYLYNGSQARFLRSGTSTWENFSLSANEKIIATKERDIYTINTNARTIYKVIDFTNNSLQTVNQSHYIKYSNTPVIGIENWGDTIFVISNSGSGYAYNGSEMKKIKDGSSHNIQDLTPFIYEANRSYIPTNTMPNLTTVPNWENVTIDAGATLTSLKTQALAFKVRNNLINNGNIITPHGLGGAGFTQTVQGVNGEGKPGESTSGIVIAAKDITNNGTIRAGDGGGGGSGYMYYNSYDYSINPANNGGTGGHAGDVLLYGEKITNNKIIQAGVGGGGGTGSAAAGLGGALGGSAGITAGGLGGGIGIYCGIVNNNFNIISGINGTNAYWSFYAYGDTSSSISSGYGGGSGGATGLNGVSGARGGNGGGGQGQLMNPSGYHGYVNTVAGAGETGYFADNMHLTGAAKPLIIKTKDFTNTGKTMTGWDTEKRNNLYDVVAETMCSTTDYWGNDFKVRNLNLISGNVSIKNLQVTEDLIINKNASILNFFDTAATGYTPVIDVGGKIISDGVIDNRVSSFRNVLRDINTDLSFIINTTGDTWLNHTNYANITWWNARKNIKINGLSIAPVYYSTDISAAGLITLNLNDYTALYNNPLGSMPNMTFKILRKIDGIDDDYREIKIETRQLGSSVQWVDWQTVLLRDSNYIVGYMNNNQPTKGFIIITSYKAEGRSEGYGVDASPPVITYFAIEGEQTETQNNKVNISLMANDNRTPEEELQANITVNNKIFVWENGIFRQVSNKDNMSLFDDSMTELPLGNEDDLGLKYIVASVRDNAGNISSKTLTITYTKPNKDATIVSEGQIVDGNGENLTKGTYQGKDAWFSKTDNITINHKPAYNNSKIRFSFEGFPWNSYANFSNDINLPLSKSEGLVVVNYQIMKSDNSVEHYSLRIVIDNKAPEIVSLKVPNNATATKQSNVNLEIDAKDNLSNKLKYSYTINDSVKTQPKEIINGVINITGLSNGVNNINVWVQDEVGNESSKKLSVFKL